MGPPNTMRSSTQHRIHLGGRLVEYRVVRSTPARKLRVRVGPAGVEVVHPIGRKAPAASRFLATNEQWVLEQLDRVERLRNLRRVKSSTRDQILFRGEPTRVRVER